MTIRIDPGPTSRIRAYAQDFPGMWEAEIIDALRSNFGMKVLKSDVRTALRGDPHPRRRRIPVQVAS